MNLVAVEGGNTTQREICEKVVHYMIGKLMPRMRTLDIEVQLKNLTGDAVGFCMMEENNRMFTIEADKKMGIKDLVTTICHEMIHVKQYARKEMDDWSGTGVARWKTKTFNAENTNYYKLPWEKEAYRLQDKYANMVWNEEII